MQQDQKPPGLIKVGEWNATLSGARIRMYDSSRMLFDDSKATANEAEKCVVKQSSAPCEKMLRSWDEMSQNGGSGSGSVVLVLLLSSFGPRGNLTQSLSDDYRGSQILLRRMVLAGHSGSQEGCLGGCSRLLTAPWNAAKLRLWAGVAFFHRDYEGFQQGWPHPRARTTWQPPAETESGAPKHPSGNLPYLTQSPISSVQDSPVIQ